MSRKQLSLAFLILLVTGCATQQGKLAWRVKDMAFAPSPMVALQGSNQEIVLTIPTRTIQDMLLAHLRISLSSEVQAELFIVEGDLPNAFARMIEERRIIAINIGMMKLIGDEIDQYAALLGHEAAHWAKGHVEGGRTRVSTLKAAGTLARIGLGLAGVPAGGLITGLAVDLIEASYSRDQEREADAQSLEYMLANNYDPTGAIRLQEKMLKDSRRGIPFLSSHPSGEERIENLKALIEGKKSQR